MDIEKEFKRWLTSEKLAPSDRDILLRMDDKEKEDAFFKDIEFGTAGMRGVLGPGTNRINDFTITKANVGFGLYLKERFKDASVKGVVISHDNRLKSREFTLLCSSIFNKMGIKTYIFDGLRPTPELSFAVRYSKAAGGIMITASHNPKEHNGYKVYDENGCQLVPGKIKRLLEIIDSLPSCLDVEIPLSKEKGEQIVYDARIDEEYVNKVLSIQVNPDLTKKGFKVVYSPQHGASYENAMMVFSRCGYEIIEVKEQCSHDPCFGGTLSPNPEADEAWIKPLEYAKRENADLIVMTDPDGDRCGVGYKSKDGSYKRFTGNQSAALLLDYLLSEKKRLGTLPPNPVIYDTIVSSSLSKDVAAYYGVNVESFLTGFKFIGDRIAHYEEIGNGPSFVFGYEESYGCLISPFVRDKDGIQAILMYTEMALFYHLKGIPLDEAYRNLELRLGFHEAETINMAFKGADGERKMKELMNRLHEGNLSQIASIKVISKEDYLKDIVIFDDGKTLPIEGLPPSDVVKFVLADKSTVAIRPSGTEPKVKFYLEAVGETDEGLKEKISLMFRDLSLQLGLD